MRRKVTKEVLETIDDGASAIELDSEKFVELAV